MEDDNKIMNDGEPKVYPEQWGSKIPGKKLKLNDGSSQDSFQESDHNYLPTTTNTQGPNTCSLEETGKNSMLN